MDSQRSNNERRSKPASDPQRPAESPKCRRQSWRRHTLLHTRAGTNSWHAYLEVIARHCPRELNILDHFHMADKINKAFDEVSAGEARRMVRESY